MKVHNGTAMELRGAARAADRSSWKPPFVTGAIVWTVIHVLGWGLRLGSDRPRLGDLKLLYYLAGTGAVDSYLVGRARLLLLVLHVLFAVVLGGFLTAGLARLTESLLRAALLSAVIALLVQITFFVPISP